MTNRKELALLNVLMFALERSGEQGEDWRSGDSLQSLDVPGGVHVERSKSDEHNAENQGRQYN